jgi:hypothetical protein
MRFQKTNEGTVGAPTCLNNTPSLFVGQIFIFGDHYSLYQYGHVSNCTVEFSSFRSSPVDCSGSTFFSPRE